MANRLRKINMHFYVTEEEEYIIKEKMKLAHITNLSDYLRSQALFGFVYYADFEDIRNVSYELSKIGTNLNQIAKQINTSGNVYEKEMTEIKELMNEVWHTHRSILSSLQLTSL